MLRKNLKFLLDSTKRYRVSFGLLLFFIICAAVTSLTFPYITGNIVDTVFYDLDFKQFWLCFLFYVLLYFLNQLFNAGINYYYAVLNESYLTGIRSRCFSRIMQLDPRVLVSSHTGDLIKRMDADVGKFLEFIHFNLFFSINDILHLAGAIAYLTWVSPMLGGMCVCIVPVMYYVSRYFANKLTAKIGRMEKDKGLLSAWLYEILKGFREIKLLNAGQIILDKYVKNSRDIVKQEIRTNHDKIKSERTNSAITLIGELLLMGVAAYLVTDGKLTIGQFVASETYFASCAAYYRNFHGRLTQMVANMVSIDRVRELFEMKTERKGEGETDHVIQKGEVIFKNVWFSYGEKPVLKNLGLEIKDGEHVVLVGKSGEGKSTIIDLICSIYAADSGSVSIDDLDVNHYTLESLHRQIGVVQQRCTVYRQSVRYNIALSEEKAYDDKIWELLRIVNLEERVKAMPEGLDTVLGENNLELSGGQKQRIAIARVLFKNPKILIFDEATSAVDGESEQQIDRIMEKAFRGRTTITIAHRFSTILRAERILVVDGGKIAAEGEHSVLLETCDIYRKLYNDFKRA